MHRAGADAAMRTGTDLDWNPGVPPTINADAVLDTSVAAVRRQLGDVFAPSEPSMGAEDFAMIARQGGTIICIILRISRMRRASALVFRRWRGRLWSCWRNNERKAVSF